MTKNIKAVVPARSGSKRLKNKNMRLLNGRPLLFYTIDSLIGHDEIEEIIFTTDSREYIDAVIKEYGKSVRVEQRPETYASDTTKVKDEVERLNTAGILDTEWFMLCLPTSPLRDFETVKEVLNSWKSDRIARFTACAYDFPTQFAFDINLRGEWQSNDSDSPMITGNTRSQDIPLRYRPNGALYLHRTETLQINKTFYVDARPVLMSSVKSIDVDSELDFKLVEMILEDRR
jgi:CMP-N-acetylneuraminic acid synthetase